MSGNLNKLLNATADIDELYQYADQSNAQIQQKIQLAEKLRNHAAEVIESIKENAMTPEDEAIVRQFIQQIHEQKITFQQLRSLESAAQIPEFLTSLAKAALTPKQIKDKPYQEMVDMLLEKISAPAYKATQKVITLLSAKPEIQDINLQQVIALIGDAGSSASSKSAKADTMQIEEETKAEDAAQKEERPEPKSSHSSSKKRNKKSEKSQLAPQEQMEVKQEAVEEAQEQTPPQS